MKFLIKYLINRSLFINLLTFFILLVGFISLRSINRESYPHVDRKRLFISVFYPGASPHEVESGVTIPLEDAIKGLDGIKEYTSYSVKNSSSVRVIIDDDVEDVEKVKTDIRRAIDNVDLPDEITKRPSIWEWKVSSFAIMEIGVFSKTLSYGQLRIRTKDLKKKLKELDSIKQVDDKGVLDREIKIKLNLKQLEANYISIQEVIKSVRAHNIEVTGGTFKDGIRDTILSVFAKFNTLDDVKNIIIRSTFEGTKIYLKDIAQVEDEFADEVVRVRFNGKEGISVYPRKKENADIIKTTDQIKKVVAEYKRSLKDEDIDFVYLWDISTDTRTRLSIVQNNALIGFILVISILFLFMNIKNAVWTAAGIPLSIAFAMIFLYFFNITINSISLLGIIVVMGMVVDDAIIISENIYRHRLQGKSWVKAAYKGTVEVANPVIITVLTTIVAFIPLFNLKGMVGDFTKEIPLVVIFVLTGSLFEALFILPNHLSHNFGIKESKIEPEEKKFIKKFRVTYEKVLERLLDKKYRVILTFIVFFIASYYILFSGKVIKFIGFPSEETSVIYISGQVQKGQNLDYTTQKVKIIESVLDQYPKDIIRSYGSDIGSVGYPENFYIGVNLTPPSKRKIKSDSIISNIRKVIEQSATFTNVYFQKETGGPPEGRAINLQIVGNDNKKRREIADEIYRYLTGLKGIKDMTRSDEEDKKEVKIMVDHNKAARSGVSPYAIGETIRASFSGVIATEIQEPDELVSYRVILEDRYKNSLLTLEKLNILNDQNRLVKLSPLINIKKQDLVSRINHYNGDRTTIIEADVEKKKITPKEIYDKLLEDFDDFEKKHPGFRLIIGGEAKESQETIGSMINASIVAISLIFFMLIMLFRSVSQSFVVLLAIPFSIIGIAVALLIHNMVLSTMALFGLVGLAGVVVNDSLVMVSYINSLKTKIKKSNIKNIIVEGASTRLRPILLTTITTIAGLVPTAYGLGGKDPMIVPTTIVMSWGLAFATSLTLFLIPLLYLAEYNVKQRIKKLFGKKRQISRAIMILLIIPLPFKALAQGQKITLHEFMDHCMKNNPEIFSALSDIALSEAEHIQAKAIHDIVFNIHYNRIFSQPFSEFSSDKIGEQKTDNLGAGINWMVPYLGTKLGTGLEYNKTRLAFSPGSSLPFTRIDYYSPEIYINVSQPLLKNWLGIVDRFPLKQTRLNKLITTETVKESIESILIDLYNLYFDWYLLYNQYHIYSTNVKNSQILLEQITRKFKADLSDRSDMSQTKILNIEYQKAQELHKIRYDIMSRKIYMWMHGSVSVPSDLAIYPEDKVDLMSVDLAQFSLDKTRQKKILNLTRTLLEETLKKDKSGLLPELNFLLSYNIRNYTQDSDKIFESMDYKDYTIGLELVYPLGAHQGRGQVKTSQESLKKWGDDFKDFELSYTQSFDQLVNIWKVYKDILEHDEELIEQGDIKLKEEEKKYRQGRSDLYFIIQDKNDLLQYNLTYLQDYIELKRLSIQILGMMDKIHQ
ncbi:MAG: efflux RND transporter permease subunit [Spirochaetes bacterium]|nr:efflux RND transporter permease subunit [Spirochaetota bacterium]